MRGRTSRPTGQVWREGDSIFRWSQILFDNAEAVTVRTRYHPMSMVTYLGANGWTCTFVCCGPAAPYPPAYSETVRPGVTPDWKVYVMNEIGVNSSRGYQMPADSRVPADVVWPHARDEYAWHIEGREDELL